jgi:hypothetical protein
MSSLDSKAQDVSCVTGISIQHVITDPVTQDTSCALETRLDIHQQVAYYYILYRDTSNTGYVLCLRDYT